MRQLMQEVQLVQVGVLPCSGARRLQGQQLGRKGPQGPSCAVVTWQAGGLPATKQTRSWVPGLLRALVLVASPADRLPEGQVGAAAESQIY